MRRHKPGRTLQNFANRLRDISGYWDFLILKDIFQVFFFSMNEYNLAVCCMMGFQTAYAV